MPVSFGAAARPVQVPAQAGPCRLFAGVRGDPCFADADGAWPGFQWTGPDAFAHRNVLTIALEVPDNMLGPDPVIGVWATGSGYSTAEAKAAARQVRPDILRYDRTQPAAYPNGRALADDVVSARLARLSDGKIGSQGLKPHDDLRAEFPTSARPTPTQPASPTRGTSLLGLGWKVPHYRASPLPREGSC
jgi:hypothetical protein